MNFVPLYVRIKQRIYDEILTVQSADGSPRLPTERELQARYKVSRPTISKALAALAAEGLVAKIQGSGSFALSLPPETTVSNGAFLPRRIGYIAPLSEAALVQRAFRGIDRAAHRRDYRVLAASAGHSMAREHDAVRELIASGVRGLIIYPVTRIGAEWDEDFLRTETFDIPIILIDTCWPEQGYTQVIFDNRRAGYAMTSWLLGKGHRRIGLLIYDAAMRHASLAARLTGYQEALCDHSLSPDPALIRRWTPTLGPAALEPILDNWFALSHPPTAIIAPEDMAALELIELLHHRGVRVPEEVRVVGFDNQEAARRFRPAFPTTNPHFERMGELACDLLLESIETGPLPPRTYILEVPLHARNSSELSAAPPHLVPAR